MELLKNISGNTSKLRKKILATVFVLVFCAAFVQGLRLLTGPKGKFLLDRRVASRAKGNPGAPVWIVEYVDFQCGTCRLASVVLHEYLERTPSQIYLQVRFRPLVITHLYALKSAIYAECAASQGKFWPFYDLLFQHQDQWKDSLDADGLFVSYAREAGLDTKKLELCVSNPEAKKKVIAENDEAMDLGIRSTPTFFINGKLVVGLEALKEELSVHFPAKKETAAS